MPAVNKSLTRNVCSEGKEVLDWPELLCPGETDAAVLRVPLQTRRASSLSISALSRAKGYTQFVRGEPRYPRRGLTD